MNTYTIPFDSPDGRIFSDYIDNCEAATHATYNLIRDIVLGKFEIDLGFRCTPEHVDQLELIEDDSFDAGSFMAIAVPEAIASQVTIDPDLWVKVDDCYIPRVAIAAHEWHRYTYVRNIFKERGEDPQYAFYINDNPRSKEYGWPIMSRYGTVKATLLPDNRKILSSECRHLTDQTRLAMLTRYDFRHDYDPATKRPVEQPYTPVTQDAMSRSRHLIALIEQLPTVASGTLLKALHFKLPSEATRGFKPTFSWETDDANQCYTITTNLLRTPPKFYTASLHRS